MAFLITLYFVYSLSKPPKLKASLVGKVQTIGIKRYKKRYQIASLSKERAEIRIHFIEDTSSAKVESFLKKGRAQVIAGVSSSRVLMRSFTSLVQKKALLKKLFPMKQKELFPFQKEQGALHTVVYPKETGFFVEMFLTPKVAIEKLLARYSDVALDRVSLEPLALFRFARFAASCEENLIVVHVEEDLTTLLLIEKGQMVKYVSLEQGSDAFEKAYQDLKEKEEGGECFDALDKKIGRALYFLMGKNPGQLLKSALLFTGPCNQSVIKAVLFASSAGSFEQAVLTNSAGFHASSLLSHAIPIGLCLDSLADDEKSCQLLTGEFTPKHHVKRLTRQLKIHTAVAAGVCLFSWGLFFSGISGKQSQIKRELDTQFRELGKDRPAFLQVLNEETLEEKLTFGNKVLSGNKWQMSYFSPAPKSGEFLAYLRGLASLKDLTVSEGFELEKLHYEIIKRPTLSRPFNSYSVRIDIAFKASSDALAKAFYKEIAGDKKRVDQNKAVTFNQKGGSYEVSFFFKE